MGDKNSAERVSSDSSSALENGKKEGEISVYITETKETVILSKNEYMCGVVAAEMPAVYEDEALKAQAVCAYTYLCKKLEENNNTNYDITDDYKTDQAYISKEKRKERWGEKFSEYENKISAAVQAVENKIITYNGEIIFAAYHAISSGKTEKAVNIWGGDYPYLSTVDSIGDLLCKDYLSEVTFSVKDFEEILKKNGAEPNGKASEYLGQPLKSDVGTVLKMSICQKEFKGTEIRTMFELRSSNFDLIYNEETGFKFTVRGYGHGVGMSQYGANYMAQQGKTFEEIIKHYYGGTKILEK
jgi:stage II sporulation protein D